MGRNFTRQFKSSLLSRGLSKSLAETADPKLEAFEVDVPGLEIKSADFFSSIHAPGNSEVSGSLVKKALAMRDRVLDRRDVALDPVEEDADDEVDADFRASLDMNGRDDNELRRLGIDCKVRFDFSFLCDFGAVVLGRLAVFGRLGTDSVVT